MLNRRSSLVRARGTFDVGQLRKPVLMLAAICWPQFCFASGYAIRESSADAMGTAYAGSAATSTDASYMAFNPASLGSASGFDLSESIAAIIPDNGSHYSATTSAIPAIGSLIPVEDWTHVTPTARVAGVIARAMRSTIWSARAVAG